MLQQTVLFPQHIAAHAKMVDFAGWNMPLHYGSQLAEHLQVRKDSGVFDVSHMGVIDVIGTDAQQYLRFICANDVARLEPNTALYTCMLNTAGGIIDDLIVYYLKPNYYRLVVNAATKSKDLSWLRQNIKDQQVEITLRTDLSILAIQGPNAIAQFIAATDNLAIKDLKRFACLQFAEMLIARTGYTGEDGLEVILPHAQAIILWDKLLKQGVKPVGLAARDTLRLEAGLNLYGNDMDEEYTPFESNLAWTVKNNTAEREFCGSKSLQSQISAGINKQLVGIVLNERGMLRHGQKIFSGAECVGEVTSGSFAPSLQLSIGLARVQVPVQAIYTVDIRGKQHEIKVVTPPFVKNGVKNFNY